VHASDAEEAEALLLRWGPDGMGKIATPYWAEPIKKILRNQAAARERLGTVKLRQLQMNMSDVGTLNNDDRNPQVGPSNLRVVNGNSAFTNTTSSSSPTTPPTPTATRQVKYTGSKLAEYVSPKSQFFTAVNEVSESAESVTISESSEDTIRRRNSIEIIDIPDEISLSDADDGHPTSSLPASRLSNPLSVDSSRGWLNTPAGLRLLGGFGIPDTVDGPLGHNTYPSPIPEDFAVPSRTRRPVEAPLRINIEPSIAALDRAASAKIYFENIYFPILRKPPSREQRRLALEKDLAQLVHLTEVQKDEVRQRWRLNETEYLREKRRRVSPEAFTRLRVIGHGAFGIVSLVREKTTGNLYAMKQVSDWYAEICQS
jgi:protein-serine/threonine kinase